MNKIRILPPHEALKIAAGEVVERPANIVKELLENALDAGATTISLYLEKAGKELIRIVDNGCGMSPEDARLCFVPHATSKITSLDDLETIATFGFRGEALASIAAVSKVTLITRLSTETDLLGTRIAYTAGSILQEETVACPQGTDITIADLFYTTPVRKKFLKQDATELNQITALVNAFCLSNHHVHFKLFHDDKIIINAPAVTNVKDRCAQLWDYTLSEKLLDFTPIQPHPDYLFTMTGYISQPTYYRYGRDQIFLFVNNRWIKNSELTKALIKGYLQVLPQGRFPAGIIFINIDISRVDINVHPKKEEVRFIRPGIVEQQLAASVQQTLEQHTTSMLSFVKTQESRKPFFLSPSGGYGKQDLGTTQGNSVNQGYQNQELSTYTSRQASPIEIGYIQARQSTTFSNSSFRLEKTFHQPTFDTTFFENLNVQQTDFVTISSDELDGTIIGQLFATYILIEHRNELIMIDQHAAHERILYEESMEKFEHKEGVAMLFPEIITLPSGHIELILKEQDFFDHQGIKLERIGERELVIKTSPPRLNNQSIKELIEYAAVFIEEHEHLEQEIFRKELNEHIHSHMACKAAVKAGDVLSLKEMRDLITNLAKTNKRFICVHGRPTIWKIDRFSIEKNFKRR